MEILTTPEARFTNLPDWPYPPHYTEVFDGEGGTLNVHHVDVGPEDGDIVLCMHGQPTWGYLYRHMIPILVDAGLRVIVPDLVGFGRSDKPAAREDFSYQRQVDWLGAWLATNDFSDITLMAQDWGGLVGLRLVADHPSRFARILVANTGLPAPVKVPQATIDAVEHYRAHAPTPSLMEMAQALRKPDPDKRELAFAQWQKWCWETPDLPIGMMIAGTLHGRSLSPDEIAAYDAPFPDASYKMGPRAMPALVPILPDDPALPAQLEAWGVLSSWERPFLCAFTDNDPVTRGADQAFIARVPGAKDQPHTTIEGGGHFLQEGRAEALSRILIDFTSS